MTFEEIRQHCRKQHEMYKRDQHMHIEGVYQTTDKLMASHFEASRIILLLSLDTKCSCQAPSISAAENPDRSDLLDTSISKSRGNVL